MLKYVNIYYLRKKIGVSKITLEDLVVGRYLNKNTTMYLPNYERGKMLDSEWGERERERVRERKRQRDRGRMNERNREREKERERYRGRMNERNREREREIEGEWMRETERER
jgi:hypothetical protein